MPRYVIERDLPGAGKLSQRDLQAVAIMDPATAEG